MSNLNQKITGIYAITPNQAPNILQIQQILAQHLVTILQYRRKISCAKTKLKEANALQKICQKHNCIFIINDDVLLAKKINADGVHLGKNDTDIITARAILGNDKIIGVSCYNDINLAKNAQKLGANYVAFGAIFPSKTKPDATHCSLKTLQLAYTKLQIPVVAIGGIDFTNLQILTSSCNSTAMVSALFQSTNHLANNTQHT
jgi:thiamine-phosphate pyrophosphorylase